MRPIAILRPVLLAGVALALAGGCGVGQNTQMSEQEAAINGGNGDIGAIAVRNVEIAYPEGDEHFYEAGSEARVVLTIANTGSEADELTSASSPVARSVTIDGERTLPAQGTLRAVVDDGESGGTGGTDQERGRVSVTLEGLTEDVKPGRTIPVTFLFRQAGEVTVDVPIAAPDEGRAESDH